MATISAPGAIVAYGPKRDTMTAAYVTDGHFHPPRGTQGGGDAQAQHGIAHLRQVGDEQLERHVGHVGGRRRDLDQQVQQRTHAIDEGHDDGHARRQAGLECRAVPQHVADGPGDGGASC